MYGNKKMKIIAEPGPSGNVLTTIVIGQKYLDEWMLNAKPQWIEYCKKHELGLIAVTDELISESHPNWKKATWQKMLLGDSFRQAGIECNNVCYLDSDILINPMAPDVFLEYNPETIGLVSQRKNIPFPLDLLLRRIAFLRHNFYDNKYPLDSALFMSLQQIFDYHDVTPQTDYACMGFILFNVNNHSNTMQEWFHRYDRNVDSITGGGDEPLINYEIQNWGNVSWLDYRFQALWVYEMAWKYPFLYARDKINDTLIRECVEASLYSSYFLHFAGSWYESQMWKLGEWFEGDSYKYLSDFNDYLKTEVTGEPQGMIKPDK